MKIFESLGCFSRRRRRCTAPQIVPRHLDSFTSNTKDQSQRESVDDSESDSGYIDVEDSGYIDPIPVITEQSQEKTRTESS